ncbi:MAG: integrin [Pseudomonadota bacterium]
MLPFESSSRTSSGAVAPWRLASRCVLSGLLVALAACGGGGGSGGGGFFPSLPPSQTATPAVPEVPATPETAPADAPADLQVRYAPKRYDFSWLPVSGATSYQLTEDPDGAGPAEPGVIATDLQATNFQRTVALHRRLNASYTVRACNAAGCSANSVPLVPDPTQAIGYLKASNPAANDQLGVSLALSADGGTMAVGAYLEDSSATGIDGDQTSDAAADAGAVYVFRRMNGLWTQQAYVKASNTEADDWFGFSVALSANGDTLAVGAPHESSGATGVDGSQSDNAASKSGAVYVYTRSDQTWAQQAYVKASNTGVDDRFGYGVAISADGHTLAVSAIWEGSSTTGIGDGSLSNNAAPNAGAAYVYVRTGSVWSQQAYVKASNTKAGDGFGHAVALSADGHTLAVGSLGEDSGAAGVGGDQADSTAWDSGAVYLYTRTGSVWMQQAYVKASNTGAGDLFGSGLALSADGRTLAVGSYMEASSTSGIDGNQADNSAPQAGAVYVFAREDGSSTWAQQAYVKAPNASANSAFGFRVALSADGNLLAVAAPIEGGGAIGIAAGATADSAPSAGAAYVYARSGGLWTQRTYVKASNTDAGDLFGCGLALSADGGTLAVGAIRESGGATGIGGDLADNSKTAAGAVYLY